MGKILVVDDDPAMRHTICRLLRRGGHEVVPVDDGEQCVEACRAANAELVITDLYMPRRDGLETLLEMRTELPQVPVIVMSGHRHSDLMLKAARELGAVITLQKPFTSETLLTTVATQLSGARSRNEPTAREQKPDERLP